MEAYEICLPGFDWSPFMWPLLLRSEGKTQETGGATRSAASDDTWELKYEFGGWGQWGRDKPPALGGRTCDTHSLTGLSRLLWCFGRYNFCLQQLVLTVRRRRHAGAVFPQNRSLKNGTSFVFSRASLFLFTIMFFLADLGGLCCMEAISCIYEWNDISGHFSHFAVMLLRSVRFWHCLMQWFNVFEQMGTLLDMQPQSSLSSTLWRAGSWTIEWQNDPSVVNHH